MQTVTTIGLDIAKCEAEVGRAAEPAAAVENDPFETSAASSTPADPIGSGFVETICCIRARDRADRGARTQCGGD